MPFKTSRHVRNTLSFAKLFMMTLEQRHCAGVVSQGSQENDDDDDDGEILSILKSLFWRTSLLRRGTDQEHRAERDRFSACCCPFSCWDDAFVVYLVFGFVLSRSPPVSSHSAGYEQCFREKTCLKWQLRSLKLLISSSVSTCLRSSRHPVRLASFCSMSGKHRCATVEKHLLLIAGKMCAALRKIATVSQTRTFKFRYFFCFGMFFLISHMFCFNPFFSECVMCLLRKYMSVATQFGSVAVHSCRIAFSTVGHESPLFVVFFFIDAKCVARARSRTIPAAGRSQSLGMPRPSPR